MPLLSSVKQYFIFSVGRRKRKLSCYMVQMSHHLQGRILVLHKVSTIMAHLSLLICSCSLKTRPFAYLFFFSSGTGKLFIPGVPSGMSKTNISMCICIWATHPEYVAQLFMPKVLCTKFHAAFSVGYLKVLFVLFILKSSN